jgi:hypothetical protein
MDSGAHDTKKKLANKIVATFKNISILRVDGKTYHR